MADTDLYVENFKSKLTYGGARDNLFRVVLTGIADKGKFGNEDTAAFLCKGASLPGSKVASITVPFRGREIKVAGDRTFDQWTVKIINETDFNLRNSFEYWMNSINTHLTNIGDQEVSTYKTDMEVHQLTKSGDVIKSYFFIGAFPISVGEIGLSYSAAGAIEEFDVVFDYDYWTSTDTTS